MSIVVFVLLALIAAAAIAYPLLPGRAPAPPVPVVTDREIAHTVSELRRSRRRGGTACPACGHGYQAGDQFCVRCGGELPQGQAAAGPACPSCGASLHGDEQFCAKCGQALAEGETA